VSQKHFYTCDVPGCGYASPVKFDSVIELRYGNHIKLTIDLCHKHGTHAKMQKYQAKLLEMIKEEA